MKIDDIMIGKKISQHLHRYDQGINPDDTLKIIRLLARKGRKLGSIYSRHDLFYTNSLVITREEFNAVYEQPNNQPEYLLDKYTRDDLVNKVGSDIRVISSTTKAEIIQKILSDRNLIFKHFKKDVVEKYSTKWQDFRCGKVLLPAASDSTKTLVFSFGSKPDRLSGSQYLQYWSLGKEYEDCDLTDKCTTDIIGETLVINLKENDKLILDAIHKYIRQSTIADTLHLKCLVRRISDESLDLRKANGICYETGLFNLVEHFGLRKGSKLKTFCAGIKQRQNSEILAECIGKKYLFSMRDKNIYAGIDCSKELFEKIAWHLKLEYMNEGQILCKVVEEESPETIVAIWDTLISKQISGWFYFIEIGEEAC